MSLGITSLSLFSLSLSLSSFFTLCIVQYMFSLTPLYFFIFPIPTLSYLTHVTYLLISYLTYLLKVPLLSWILTRRCLLLLLLSLLLLLLLLPRRRESSFTYYTIRWKLGGKHNVQYLKTISQSNQSKQQRRTVQHRNAIVSQWFDVNTFYIPNLGTEYPTVQYQR